MLGLKTLARLRRDVLQNSETVPLKNMQMDSCLLRLNQTRNQREG
jgi:hypothetical protein